MPPIAQSDVSTSILIFLSKSDAANTSSFVNLSFSFLNIFSCLSVYSYFCFFFTILCNGLAITAKSLINHQQQFTSPKNFCMSLTLCRVGQSKTLFIFSFSILIFSSSILSSMVHTGVEVHGMDLWNNLGFSLCAALSVCHVVVTSDDRKKSKLGVSADWCVTIEHQRLSSIRVIFVNYQTYKLQCNYQSYIQMDSIGDTQDFSSETPITLSRGFSVETLTEVTPSWKTKLNRDVSTKKDRIPRGLQHHPKTCCKKGGHHGRQACMITPQRCNFWMGGLAYDSIPLLGLSL